MDVGTVLSVAQTLLATLQCSEVKQFLSQSDYKSELEDLQRTVSTINVVFRDAETKQELTHEEKHWIEELKDAVFEADDLFDEIFTLAEQKQLVADVGKLSEKVKRFFSLTNNPLTVAYRTSQGVKGIKKKLDEMATNREKFGFKIDSEPIRKRRPETCSYVNEVDIIGREDDLEKIVDILLTSNNQRDVSFLTIVGMGGLGKTTLAQLVYNDPRITSGFPLKLWTCVADQDQKVLDVKEILGKILASATYGNHDQGSTLDQVQRKVRQELGGNKFLLVLDDVWTEKRDEWCELVKYLTTDEKGSWIVLTTRSKMTAKITGGSMFELQGLSEDSSWRLFENTAFGPDQSNPSDDLVKIGQEILHGCARVPLAIRVVGSLLFGQEKGKWQLFKKIGLADIRKSNDIIPILKLSFDNLETPVKNCFKYCALFPKDFLMDKHMIIQLWMAQGYVAPNEGQSIEEVAEEFFLILLRRCFFQDIEKDYYGEIVKFKMHDLMHDIALTVSGKEITHVGLDNISANLDTKARHLSIARRMGYNARSWGKTLIRSHLFVESPFGTPKYQLPLEAIFENYRHLRALDLSGLHMKSIPDFIGKLFHLRYLDLQHCRNLEVLPKSITKLYNLKTLNLAGCYYLKELPKNLSRLVKLRVLNMTECYALQYMPRGISKLSCLHTLGKFIISGEEGSSSSWKQCFNEIEDLKALNNLRGDLQIQVKWPTNDNKDSFNKEHVKRKGLYLKSKEHLNFIKFDFKKEEGGERVDDEVARRLMEDMHPHPNLRRLNVWGYQGVRMPSWITLLPNLVQLYLYDCEELEYLPYLGNLCHLKVLWLWRLKNLEYIEGMESCTKEEEVVSLFPSLEQLYFNNLPKLKECRRIGMEDKSSSINPPLQQPLLPRLSQLTILLCPKLRFIPLCAKVEDLGHDIHNPTHSFSFSCVNKLEDDSASTSGADILLIPILREVILDDAAWLNSLPMEVLQSVETLRISKIDDLPNCMEFMTALQTLDSSGCRRLKAMPNWMPKLTSIRKLRFDGCSKRLERRCQRDPPGEDWPYIQHIPDILFERSLSD